MSWILNENYRRRRNGERPEWIVIHYPAMPGATAEKVISAMQNSSRCVSTHYAVDEFAIVPGVPVKYAAYHVGGKSTSRNGCFNGNSIGIDLCDNKFNKRSRRAEDSDWYILPATLRQGAGLVAKLMADFDIQIDHVVRHYDVTGKRCPAPLVGSQKSYNYPGKTCDEVWQEFKKLVLRERVRYVK